MGRALVTGGAGLIGSPLAERRLDDGWEVFDLWTSSLERSSRGAVVFHLAAAVGGRLIVERLGHTLLTNVCGTKNILECASRFEKPVFARESGAAAR